MNDDFNKGDLAAAAGTDTGNIGKTYVTPSAAIKFQPSEHVSVGFIYEHPFGADAGYPTKDLPTYTLNDDNTGSKVKTESLSSIIGYQPNKNWNLYGGVVVQSLEAESHAHGAGFKWMNYDMKAPKETGNGWLAGVAYSVPEIALQVALTYRSEIDHKVNDMTESVAIESPAGVIIDFGTETTSATLTTPQSVNLDLQTGIAKGTVAFANVRWVDWNKNPVRPPKLYESTEILTGKGTTLVSYYDDQISANLGVGRKLSPKWGGNVSVGWDSGAGELVSTQGPVNGYWNVGAGLKFNPQPNYDISFGVKYFWLGDAKSQSASDFGTSNYDAEFTDNSLWAYGLKLGYRF